jgi:sugar lactone lactonase YvrE
MIHFLSALRSVGRHAKLFALAGFTALVLFAGIAPAAKAQLSVAVGSTSVTQIATVSITTAGATATTTATAIFVLTQGTAGLDFNFVSGGSCALSHTYAAGVTCTVEYTFKPKYSGVRYGAVQLKSSAGVVLGTAFISGIGTGPQPIFPSTTTTTLPGTYNQPRNMAIDGAGDIYVSNFGGRTVAEIPAGCTTSSCVTTVGGTFSGPVFVAVDGAGSIYFADFVANVVDEMPPGCINTSCLTELGGGFDQPISVRVDGSGNVFVADFGNSAVKKIPPGCTTSACVVQLGSGFSNPQDVALDGSGNIYVADYGNSLVKSMPASCSNISCTVTTLGGGFSSPSGVAVDGNGNVYVGDAGNNAVKVMTPNCTPANASTCVTNLGIVFNAPIGVTLDGGGDLYVADNGNNALREIPRATAPSLTFATVDDGSTGTAQTISLTNYGNKPLVIAEPSSGVNPDVSSGFTLATTGTGGCPSVSAGGTAAPLTANASCTLIINFAPVYPDSGLVTGSVILTDNNANVSGSSQTIALSGNADTLVPAITSISPAEGAPAGGTTVTINGSLLSMVTAVQFGGTSAKSFHLVSDTQMTAVSPAEVVGVVDIQATNSEGQSFKSSGDQFTYTNSLPNTITFPALPNGTFAGTPPVPAAYATSGVPVTYTSSTSLVCTIAGTSITYVDPGTCTITAAQNATGSYASAAPVSQSFQVLLTENVGTKSATLTATLTFTTAVTTHTAFTTSVMTMGVTGQDFNLATGGTCVSGVAFAVGATCTVNYTFKPLYAGIRSGGIALTTGSGTSEAIVASVYIGGEGIGPQIVYPPSATQLTTTQGAFTIDGNGTLYELGSNSSQFFITVIPAGCLTTACQSQITSLPGSATQGLAIDGIGNIFLADSSGKVYELPPGCRGSCSVALTIVPEATSIAVDRIGNLYVAASNGLIEIPAGCLATSTNCSVELGGGVGNLTESAQTIAIDFTGDVYFVNEASHGVYMLTPNCLSSGCVTRLGGSSFSGPTGVAADPNGNVYVADMGHSEIYRMSPNCLSSSCVQTIFQLEPYFGVLLDGQGNLYVSGILYVNSVETLGLLKLSQSTLPSFTFPTTPNGDTSQPLTTSITNYGNEPLVFSVPSSGTNPSASANFALETGVTGECPQLTASSTSATLAPSATCSLPIEFAPVAASGTVSGSLTLTDNNLYATAATQVFTLTGTVAAKPTVSAVSPSSGPLAGASVTITGTNFYAGAAVSFGGKAATAVTLNSTTSIAVTAPAHAAGTVDVTVTIGSATSATSSADRFTYAAPSVTGISPSTGPSSGGSGITITGTNFGSDATVSFGGIPGTAVTVNNATSISVTSPASAAGTVDVTVTTGGATTPVISADHFTFIAPPVVTGILPAFGPLNGGTSVTLSGTNFMSGAQVFFGDVQATSVTITSPTSITATSPPTDVGVGAVDVTVTEGSVTSATSSADNFTYGLYVPVGSTSAVQTALVTILTAGTLGTIDVLTTGQPNLDYAFVAGGSCATGKAYAANTTCTVNYTLTPRAPGIRNGAVQLVTSGNASVLGTALFTGIGKGPAVTYPASQSIATLGSGFDNPYSMAVDAAGNVYVADFTNNAVTEIVAVNGSIPANPTIRTLGSGFNSPTGIAVDGAGNIYVADFGNHAVKEILSAGGSIPASNPSILNLAAGQFGGPVGVAVDGAGNVYLTDALGGSVWEIVAQNGTAVELADPFNNPEGIAVDGSGNIFVADYGYNAVQEIQVTSGNIVTLGGFIQPNGVAVDAAGDVYVADAASGTVSEILAVNGSIPLTGSTILNLGAGFTQPTGVTVDAAGDVYVADNSQSKVYEIKTSTPPSLSFASTNVGSTSSPQSFSLQNIGNQNLTLSVPAVGGNPAITSGYSLNAASTCPVVSAGGSAGAITEGTLCTESVSFAPTTAGSDNGSLTFTDNALNVSSATQVISLNGTGFATPTVTAISPASGPVAGGTTVTITGTNFLSGATVLFGTTAATGVTVVSGTSITAIAPAGSAGIVDVTVTTSDGKSATSAADHFTYISMLTDTITFPALANTPLGAVAPALNATSTSGQAVTYAASLTTVCTVASGVVTDVAAGTCTITASQPASGQYAAATPVAQSYQVTAIPFVFIVGNGGVESFNNYGSDASKATSGGGIGAAVDAAGYVWSIDASGSGVSRFSPSAGALVNDYTGIGLNSATALAIDGKGQVWITNASGTVSMLTNAGVPAATINDASFSGTTSIAIDISGTVWVTNATNNTVDEIIGGAAPSAPLANAVQNNTPGTRP